MTFVQPTSPLPDSELLRQAYGELEKAQHDTAGSALLGVLEQIPGFNLGSGVRERIHETAEVVRDEFFPHKGEFQLAKATIFGTIYPLSQMGAVHITPLTQGFKQEIGISFPTAMGWQSMSLVFDVRGGVFTYGFLDVRNHNKGFTFKPQEVGHEIISVDEEKGKNKFFSPGLAGKQISLPRIIHAFTTPGTLPYLYASDFQQKMEEIILAQ